MNIEKIDKMKGRDTGIEINNINKKINNKSKTGLINIIYHKV